MKDTFFGHSSLRFPYRLDNVTVSKKVTCKDLGNNVSNDLSFPNHCDRISRTTNFRRRQFEKSFAAGDKDFKVFLFCTYMISIILRTRFYPET